MKLVVCVKQVPDTKGGVKFNPDGTLDRGAMLAIMNPDDKAGLEAALRLQDQYGAEVTVVTTVSYTHLLLPSTTISTCEMWMPSSKPPRQPGMFVFTSTMTVREVSQTAARWEAVGPK